MSKGAAAKKTTGFQDDPVSAVTVRPQVRSGEPTLDLAGIQFFFVDVATNSVTWQEHGSQILDGGASEAHTASVNDALRHMAPDDRRALMLLIQGAVQEGKAGPLTLGATKSGLAGISLKAVRHNFADNQLVCCFPSQAEDAGDLPSGIIRGLAPIISHFISGTRKIALAVDSFGHIRYASPGFLDTFKIENEQLILGRNISHIPTRIAKSLPNLLLSAISRRSSTFGRKRFLLPDSETVELNFRVMYFRFAPNVGGVLFTGDHGPGLEVDFAKVFDAVTQAVVVVDINSKMLVAVNKVGKKTFEVPEGYVAEKQITETLLHPRNYATLLEAAMAKSELSHLVVINSMNGVSKKRRVKATLLEDDVAPKLVLETRP